MADMSLLDGYYSARTNRVAFVWPSETPFANAKPTLASATSSPSDTMYALPMDAPRTTQDPVVDIPRVQHEAAHQLAFNSGLLTRGVMYPVWVSEGLAVNFEYGGMADCVAGGNNEDRRCHLSHALCSGSLVPLDEFVTQARVNYAHDDTTVVYAQSWAFFNFLYKERPEELKKYLKMIGQLPRGRRSGETMRREFETAFGPVSQMRTAWDSFVSRVAAGHLK